MLINNTEYSTVFESTFEIPDTISDALSLMGLSEPEDFDLCIGQKFPPTMPGGKPRWRHTNLRNIPPDACYLRDARDLFIAPALYKWGSILFTEGRTNLNLRRATAIPLDFDLKDFLSLPAHELHVWAQDDLDSALTNLADTVIETCARVGVPLHYLQSSGYGVQGLVRIADEDQFRLFDVPPVQKVIIAQINNHVGRKLADPEAAAGANRLIRVPGTLNCKNPAIPRQTLVIARFPNIPPLQLDDYELPPRPKTERSSQSENWVVENLSEQDEDQIVIVMGRHWNEGVRHALSLSLAGWLAKSSVPEEQGVSIIERLAEDDEEYDDRVRAAESTYTKFILGRQEVRGRSGVRDVLDAFPEDYALIAKVLNAHHERVEGLQHTAIPTPDFPLDVFPKVVQQYVLDGARSMMVPVEMVAVPFLATPGALIGNRVSVKVKRNWYECGGIWTFLIAPPGSTKSAAINFGTKPLYALQDNAYRDQISKIRRFEANYAEWKAADKANRGQPPSEPEPMRHFYTTNSTVEALAPMVAQNSGILALYDELSGWIDGMNQYKRHGADKQNYLDLWSNTPLKLDRKMSPTVYCPRPVLSVVGGIQPDLVYKLYKDGEAQDGFMDRLLPVSVQYSPVPLTLDDESETSESVRAEVNRLFEELDAWPHLDPDIKDQGTVVSLTPEAFDVFKEWYDNNHVRLAPAESGLLRGFYSKLNRNLPRFALILHVLHYPKYSLDQQYPDISAETMRDAIKIAEFYRAHMQKFMALVKSQARKSAKTLWGQILGILEEKGVSEPGGWVMRSVLTHQLGRSAEVSQVDKILAAMEQRGIIEQRTRETATKSAEEWRIV